jgi:ADP-dependent NAD(P)H-hydrate dehydratase / NAD(P)H-hydrate epimerase
MRISAAEVRKMDEAALRDYAIPGLLLMENAGRSVGEVIFREYTPCKVLIFVGKGNNGGDGLVAARHLANHGYSVQVALLENPTVLKTESLLNFSIISKMNIPWVLMTGMSEKKISDYCQKSALLVDAIFGVGIHSPVRGIFEKAIRAINKSQRPVVSIDIPSGLDADTGMIHRVAVKATQTVTLALPKRGLFKDEGPRYAGEIEVVDIGIPRKLLLPFMDTNVRVGNDLRFQKKTCKGHV